MDRFETKRLTARHWAADLADPTRRAGILAELQSALVPEVLAPLQIGQGPDAMDQWVTDRARESDVFVLRDRQAGFVGLLILAQFPHDGGPIEVHIGYLLAKPHWGQGYASELVAGLVAWLQGQGKPMRLYGGVGRQNPASARVLVKNGFQSAPALSDAETEMFCLDISGN